MAVAPGLDQLRYHALDHVDRDRESDALVAAGLRQDRRVHANDLASRIEERSARVAGVDGRVGLDSAAQQIDLSAGHLRFLARIASSADDALGHGLLQAER